MCKQIGIINTENTLPSLVQLQTGFSQQHFYRFVTLFMSVCQENYMYENKIIQSFY